MEAGRRWLFYLDYGDTDIGVFYNAAAANSCEFPEDDDQDPRDDGTILFQKEEEDSA